MSDNKKIIILCTPPGEFVPSSDYNPPDNSNNCIINRKNTRKRSLLPTPKLENSRPRKKARKRKWRDRPSINPPFKLDTIDDLLYIAWNYQGENLDWFTLWNMIPSLNELNNMVGMKKFKQELIDIILYYIQGLHIRNEGSGNCIADEDMLHTALYGSPGTGKTSIAHILAKIYCKIGYLPTDNVIVAKKTDFVGKWVGHSEDKTTNLLNSSLGGVLFIDEAYSMGNSEKTDSYSKAAVDLLNQFLSEHKGEMICIIAGYEEELEECFFSINKGLERRFPRKFTIESYTGEELYKIFCIKVKSSGWNIGEGAVDKSFFENNIESFPFFGGDIENFFTFCKTKHSRRICGVSSAVKKELNNEDITEGFKTFCKNQKNKGGDDSYKNNQMYI